MYRPGWDRSWLRVHDEEEDRGGVPAALGGPRVRRQRARAQGAHHLGELDTRSFFYKRHRESSTSHFFTLCLLFS